MVFLRLFFGVSCLWSLCFMLVFMFYITNNSWYLCRPLKLITVKVCNELKMGALSLFASGIENYGKPKKSSVLYPWL